jgi:hypothetical protein
MGSSSAAPRAGEPHNTRPGRARTRDAQLANRFELLFADFAHETEFRGAAAPPVADHSLTFGVVVAVHHMVRRVPTCPLDREELVT